MAFSDEVRESPAGRTLHSQYSAVSSPSQLPNGAIPDQAAGIFGNQAASTVATQVDIGHSHRLPPETLGVHQPASFPSHVVGTSNTAETNRAENIAPDGLASSQDSFHQLRNWQNYTANSLVDGSGYSLLPENRIGPHHTLNGVGSVHAGNLSLGPVIQPRFGPQNTHLYPYQLVEQYSPYHTISSQSPSVWDTSQSLVIDQSSPYTSISIANTTEFPTSLTSMADNSQFVQYPPLDSFPETGSLPVIPEERGGSVYPIISNTSELNRGIVLHNPYHLNREAPPNASHQIPSEPRNNTRRNRAVPRASRDGSGIKTKPSRRSQRQWRKSGLSRSRRLGARVKSPTPGVADADSTTGSRSLSDRVVKFFNYWQRDNPGEFPSERQIIGFTLMFHKEDLKHDQVCCWFQNRSEHGAPRDCASLLQNRNDVSLQDVGTDEFSSLLRRAADQNTHYRNRCNRRLTTAQMDANRQKPWNSRRPFPCTSLCGQDFTMVDDWRKHEEINNPQNGFLCDFGPTYDGSEGLTCTYCGDTNLEPNHLESKHAKKLPCLQRNLLPETSITVYFREDHMTQHYQRVHRNIPLEFCTYPKFEIQNNFYNRCGFCGFRFADWVSRISHVSHHFKERLTLDRWRVPWDDEVSGGTLSDGGDDDDDSSDDDDTSPNDKNDEDYENPSNGNEESHHGDPNDDGTHPAESNSDDKDNNVHDYSGPTSYFSLFCHGVCGPSLKREPIISPKLKWTDIEEITKHISTQQLNPSGTSLRIKQHDTFLSSTLYRYAVLFWLSCDIPSLSFKVLPTSSIKVGRYLGRGAATVVDEISLENRVVARKTPRSTTLSLQQRNLQILNEIKCLSLIEHSHIVSSLGILASRLEYSLLMPVANCTLKNVLEKSAPGQQDKTAWLLSSMVCLISGLEYLHDNIYCTHGDIKPENILVFEHNGSTVVKIADLGLAKIHRKGNEKSRPPGCTPMYVAPEGLSGTYDWYKLDIFSLGLVFLEMAAVISGITLHELHLQIFDSRWQNRRLPNQDGSVPDKNYRNFLPGVLSFLDLQQYKMPDTTLGAFMTSIQFSVVQNMLDVKPEVRPAARDIRPLFHISKCCLPLQANKRRRDCFTCTRLVTETCTMDVLTTWLASFFEIRSSASRNCGSCKLLEAATTFIVPEALLFNVIISRTGEKWSLSVLEESRTSEIRLEFFTLQGQLPGLAMPGLHIANLVPDHQSSAKRLRLAQIWLAECESLHSQCVIPLDATLPTRVLDLAADEPRLYESLGETMSYVCLSYCWGPSSPITMTTKATLSTYKKGVPLHQAPKTFQDAVHVTRELGYQYLWIDALCIIQDDPEDRMNETTRMASIFANASLTLVATGSADSSGGLFYDRSPSEFRSSEIKDRIHCRRELPHLPSWSWKGWLGDFDYTSTYPLLSRAWTFQERILSRRLLHFTRTELLWECKEGTTCECSGNSHLIHPIHPPPMQWHAVVSEYTSRKLTCASDKLLAISGIVSFLQQRRPGIIYYSGLWEHTLTEDLLWYVSGDVSVRSKQDMFPSWSWASVSSQVHFVRRTARSSIQGIKASTTVLQLQAPFFSCSARLDQSRIRIDKSQPFKYSLCLHNRPIGELSPDYVMFEVEDQSQLDRVTVSVVIIGEVDDRSGKAKQVGLVLTEISHTPKRFKRIGVAVLENGSDLMRFLNMRELNVVEII